MATHTAPRNCIFSPSFITSRFAFHAVPIKKMTWGVVYQIKEHLENTEYRKGREEAKTEAKRLQALRENDMESYTQLVQETKNERLVPSKIKALLPEP